MRYTDSFAVDINVGAVETGRPAVTRVRTPDSAAALMQTILVVDDSPTIRRMVRTALGSLPEVTFAEAGSGLQAIETLAVQPVQAIVLDLNMPDMHGLDVLRFLRSHQQYLDVPVMVLTTRGDDTSREAALEAGATAYMTKPFSPSVLASSVKQLLEMSSARRT
jgi:two-component system chemotaxis response regulator CheY